MKPSFLARSALCMLIIALASHPRLSSAQLPLLPLLVTDVNEEPVEGLSLTLADSSPGVTNGFGLARLELAPDLKRNFP